MGTGLKQIIFPKKRNKWPINIGKGGQYHLIIRRKMQIQRIRRYHFAPISTAAIQNGCYRKRETESNEYRRGYGQTGAWCATGGSSKIKNGIPTKSSNSAFGDMSHKVKSRVSKRNLYTMFTAVLFTQPKCRQNQSVHRQMVKQNVASPHDGMLFSLKEEIVAPAST